MSIVRTFLKPISELMLFGALYLSFAGHLQLGECVAALSGGVVATFFRARLCRHGRPFASRWRDIPNLTRRVVPDMARDAWRLTKSFLSLAVGGRSPEGQFVDLPFDVGVGDAPSRSRRGLVIASISCAPNTFVVDIRYEDNVLVRHELLAAPQPSDPQWPV